MKTLIALGALLTTIIAAPIGLKLAQNFTIGKTSSEVISGVADEQIPVVAEPAMEPQEIKLTPVKKTIILEARNTVVFRGPVTEDSVGDTMRKLREVSNRLPKNTPIYLVLDTPGGSVMDGIDFIDFAVALPQKVHTVTLFAASMGFHIAQNLEKRYVIRGGTLMSHRARVSGLDGQVKGELEARYKMIRRAVDFLDFKAAQRMGMEVNKYENLTFNEYWVHGFDAVAEKAADEQVLVKCGDTLDGTYQQSFRTLFGEVTVEFSNCPLIKAPVSVDASGIFEDNREKVDYVFTLLFQDKPQFVHEYITTDRFHEIFP